MIVLSISAVFVRMRSGFALVVEGLGGAFWTSSRGGLSACEVCGAADMMDVVLANMPRKSGVYKDINGFFALCSSARMSGGVL